MKVNINCFICLVSVIGEEMNADTSLLYHHCVSELFAVSVFKVLGMRPPMKGFTEREQILQLSSELVHLL